MKYFTILFFLLCSLFSFAHDNQSDNLKIEQWRSDSTRMEQLLDTAWRNRTKDPSLAFEYTTKAKGLAIKLKKAKEIGISEIILGILARNKKEHAVAEKHFLEALEIRDSLGVKIDIASAYNNLGLNASYDQKYRSAQNYFQQGLAVMNDEALNKIVTQLKCNLANVFLRLNEHESALREAKESLQLSRDLVNYTQQGNSLLTLATIYQDRGEYSKAEEQYSQALELYLVMKRKDKQSKCYINLGALAINMRDAAKAKEYLSKALNLKKYLTPKDVGILYRNLSSTYLIEGKYDEGTSALLLSLSTSPASQTPASLASINYTLGKSSFYQKDYQEALKYYQNSYRLLDSIDNQSLKLDVCNNLSETYARLKNIDLAFKYNKEALEIQDSLNIYYRDLQINEMDLQKEKDKNIILEKEKLLLEQKQTNKNTIITSLILGLIGLAFLGLLLFLNYRNRQKRTLAEKNQEIANQKVIDLQNKKELAEKDSQLTRQRVVELVKEQEIVATYSRLEGQDLERQRIAEDLHDRLGSMLSTILLYFKSLAPKQESENSTYQKASKLLEQAAGEVRKIAHNMESGVLTEFGLEKQIRTLANTIIDSGQLTVEVLTHGLKDRLDNLTEVKVYRIIQELVNNAIKHAEASQLSIQLNRFSDVLNILVEDNGQGFDPELEKADSGMGLNNVRARLHDLNGTLFIDSQLKRGTTITIDIPLSEILQ